MIPRRVATFGLAAVLTAAATIETGAYAFLPDRNRWPDGTIVMHLQLGSSGGPLEDGSPDWDAAAVGALLAWNNVMGGAEFNRGPANAPMGRSNNFNNVFFANTIYDEAWDEGVLATTLTRYSPSAGTSVESDVLFNTAGAFNSYRGPQRSGVYDFWRTAAHEFGHVLGLDHPHDYGQFVDAIMNQTGFRATYFPATDALTADDVAGIQALYGRRGAGASVQFPARNLSLEFRLILDNLYRDVLGRALANMYVDQEGSVIWTSEIMRYLLTGCSAEGAINRVRYQIEGLGVAAPCGPLPVAGTAFGFPPRDITFQARLVLDQIYRDVLGRSPARTWVDPEGDVVWIAEYLRYFTGGCSHEQSIQNVLNTILLGVSAPLCR